MPFNHLPIAFRHFWRNRTFTAINIFGLAAGLATCLIIGLYIADELSYDKYNENAARIFRVNADFRINGEVLNERMVPAALGTAMVKEYPQIEKAVRIGGDGESPGEEDILVTKGKETFTEHNACYADESLFGIFTLPFIAGNQQNALSAPGNLVINESVAKKYFPAVAPVDIIGKTMLVNRNNNYTVTGIIQDMPAQSHIHFSFIRALIGKTASRNNNWLDNGYVTYLLTAPGTTTKTVDNYLNIITQKYAGPQLKAGMNMSFEDMAKTGDYYRYNAIPLTDIHLHSSLAREAEPSGNIVYVRMFILIAVLILFIACINFMNLSTAQSVARSKEVGIKKILGSGRAGLIGQFLTESGSISFMALLLALGITAIILPYFNQLSGKHITLGLFSHAWLLPLLLAGCAVTGLLAGTYPAFFLSSFKPVHALKGKYGTGAKRGWLRNTLVVFQFTAAIILIISTLVIYYQLSYIHNKNLGYDKEQVLVLPTSALGGERAVLFKQQLLKIAGVKNVTMADVLPTSNQSNTDVFFKDADKSNGGSMGLEAWYGDADYIPAFNIQVLQGRNFSQQMSTDASAVIINETAARALGYTDAINKAIYQQGEDGGMIKRQIIGVVKDFNAGSLRNKIPPIVFNLQDGGAYMAVRMGTNNIAAVVAEIRDTYHAMANMAGMPFTYSFMDDNFNALYQSEQRMGAIFIYFAAFAVMIGCLGLFGLVTYTAEQRTKEIGIRKVMGATVANIVAMLNKDFLRLVALAGLIAFPVAWWVMQQWLQSFAYRTQISWWIFAVAGITALFLTLLTISFKAVRAAMANPVNSLRNE